jgi:hypothetical protein
VRTSTWWPVFSAAFCFASASAHAQPSGDSVAARTLFQEARKLAAQHQYEQACPKFEESLNLDAGIGTMFNLADCWEHLGRTASAWSRFLDAASAAQNAGQTVREKVARQRAAALEPRLSRMTVTIAPAAAAVAGLEVHDGTRTVGTAISGTAVPVDPGAHTIEARAPGKKPWQTVVQVGSSGAQVTVDVPVLLQDESAPPVAAAVATPPALIDGAHNDTSVPVETARPARAGSAVMTAGWITGAVGVAGLGVGTIFGFVTESKNNQAKALCTTTCSQQAFDQHASLVESARSARTASIVGFAAGGAAVLTGAALLLLAPKGHADAVALTPAVGLDRLGLDVEGRW